MKELQKNENSETISLSFCGCMASTTLLVYQEVILSLQILSLQILSRSDNIWSWFISFNWCDIYEWVNIEVKSVRSCHQMFYHLYLIHDSNDHMILQFIQLQNSNLACRTACQVKQLELNSFHTSLISVNLNTGKRWQTFSCHKNIFIHSKTIRWSHPWLILWCQQCEATIVLIKDVIQGSLQNQKAVFPCW